MLISAQISQTGMKRKAAEAMEPGPPIQRPSRMAINSRANPPVITRIVCMRSLLRAKLTKVDSGRDAGIEPTQARGEAERLKGRFEFGAALRQVRPALVMDGDDRRAWKRVGGLDRVVGIHGEIERTARLRGTREQQHHAGRET